MDTRRAKRARPCYYDDDDGDNSKNHESNVAAGQNTGNSRKRKRREAGRHRHDSASPQDRSSPPEPASPSLDSASHPLTEANLAYFTRALTHDMASPTRSRSPAKTPAEELARLKAHKIRPIGGQHVAVPQEVQQLIDALSTKKSSGPPSAHGQRIAQLHETAAKKTEDTAIHMMARHLFLQPFLWDDGDEYPYVDVACNHNLIRGFMPEPPNQMARDLGTLENPRPDLCFGYTTTSTASAFPALETIISEEDELLARSKRICISEEVSHPFFTAQIKSALSGDGIEAAERQTMRDGAAIVRSNYVLFDLAGLPPDHSSTCHFSSTTNMQTACLYVHYRQDAARDPRFPEYHTKRFYRCDLSDEEAVAGWRIRINNIYQWAVGPRARNLQAALAALAGCAGSAKGPARDDESTTSASRSSKRAPPPNTFMATPESERAYWPAPPSSASSANRMLNGHGDLFNTGPIFQPADRSLSDLGRPSDSSVDGPRKRQKQ